MSFVQRLSSSRRFMLESLLNVLATCSCTYNSNDGISNKVYIFHMALLKVYALHYNYIIILLIVAKPGVKGGLPGCC